MTRKTTTITILTILTLTIIVGGFWYVQRYVQENKQTRIIENQVQQKQEKKTKIVENINKKKQEQITKNQIKENNIKKFVLISENPKKIVESFKDIFFNSSDNIGTKIRGDACFGWIRKDNVNFGPANSWIVSSARSDINSIEKNIKQIKKLLIDSGFKESKLNQGKHVLGIKGEKIGFEKNKIKCNIEWFELTPDNDSRKYHFEVSCANINTESKVDFNNFFIALKEYVPPKGYSKITNIEKFCITRKKGDFAKGVIGTVSAPTWYAKKEANKWVVTIITQDYPPCDSVIDFPLDYYNGKCLSNNNDTMEEAVK